MEHEESKASWWQRRNWWKIGFFVSLALFEGAREIAVMEAHVPVEVATLATVTTVEGLTVAQGRWNQIDGGEPLSPNAVRIECWRDDSRCYEASFSVSGRYANAPDFSKFDASWSADQISYQNDDPACVSYSVRVDLKLEKVFAVRQRKDKPSIAGVDCSKMEPRVEMTLTNGYEPQVNPAQGHFLPALSVFELISGN